MILPQYLIIAMILCLVFGMIVAGNDVLWTISAVILTILGISCFASMFVYFPL